MSNNNPLSPELVEKMRLEICNVGDWQVQLYSKQCAQIAVEYAEQENEIVLNAMSSLSDKYNSIKKQRGELIEALKEAITERMQTERPLSRCRSWA